MQAFAPDQLVSKVNGKKACRFAGIRAEKVILYEKPAFLQVWRLAKVFQRFASYDTKLRIQSSGTKLWRGNDSPYVATGLYY